MRKSFFVKPKVLFRYVAYALVSVIVTSICVWIVMDLTIGSSEALENINTAEIAKLQAAMMVEFRWIVVILLVVIGIQSIMMFHHIIGPIYAFEKIIREITQGRLVRNFHLRHKDEFKELATLVDGMSGTFIEYIKKDRSIITGVSGELDKLSSASPEDKKRISDIKAKLSRVTADFKIDA